MPRAGEGSELVLGPGIQPGRRAGVFSSHPAARTGAVWKDVVPEVDGACESRRAVCAHTAGGSGPGSVWRRAIWRIYKPVDRRVLPGFGLHDVEAGGGRW